MIADEDIEDDTVPTTADEEEEEDEGEAPGAEEEDEEEEEPKLKYVRLGSGVAAILRTDSARCLIPNDKFLVLGTQGGKVHVLDLEGHEILKRDLHTQPINDMSLDETGEFLATCSDDGTVAITDILSENSKPIKQSYHRPVKCVGMPANYKTSQMFATGGINSQFIINTKALAWFSSRDNVIHFGEGPIHAIRWKGDLIAWANNVGIKIYDVATSERIAFINRPAGSVDPGQYRCHLTWADKDTLLMGWGDSVKIGVVSQRASGQPNSPANRFIQITGLFQTDFIICGIAPFSKTEIALLAFVNDEEEEGVKSDKSQRPELRIMTWAGDEVSNDTLPINGFEHCTASDYRLDYLRDSENKDGEPLFYIVSPKDIVMARPRDIDDHIAWLLARKRYEEALDAAELHPLQLKHHSFQDIGQDYLEYLFKEKQYDLAAKQCNRLLGRNNQLWEEWIARFAASQQLKAVALTIPTSLPQLPQKTYETVLLRFILEDPEMLVKVVQMWPSAIYSIDAIIQETKDCLKRHEDAFLGSRNIENLDAAKALQKQKIDFLLEALALFYYKTQKYVEAVHVYIRLGRSDVFDLVREAKLFEHIRDQVAVLMQFNAEKASKLFCEYLDQFPMDSVMAQLKDQPRLQHAYLHTLFITDPIVGQKYHSLQITFYAEYKRDFLLEFLRGSNFYLLQDALKICTTRKLYPEMVFLLNKMGDLNGALTILIEQIKDVKLAIEFVEEHKDDQLWEDLINRSVDRTEFLSDLLENVGSHYVDMLKLITKIPNTLPIPNLRQKLMKILSDQHAQVSVRQGCNTILQNDCVALQRNLYLQQRQSVYVNEDQPCLVCNMPVFSRRKIENVVVFLCSHVYHSACIDSHRKDKSQASVCVRCQKDSWHSRKSAID